MKKAQKFCGPKNAFFLKIVKKKCTTTIGTLLEGYTCALLLGVNINKIIKIWKLEYSTKN
jgi:hypothetical protein